MTSCSLRKLPPPIVRPLWIFYPSFIVSRGRRLTLLNPKFSSPVTFRPATGLLWVISFQVNCTENLGVYLDFPLHHTRPAKESYQFVFDKVLKKLAGWKSNNLVMASRVTLPHQLGDDHCPLSIICSVIGSPNAITNTLDIINCNFLWGSSSTNDKHKVRAVSWDNVTKPWLWLSSIGVFALKTTQFGPKSSIRPVII